jgi:hypothetical protein
MAQGVVLARPPPLPHRSQPAAGPCVAWDRHRSSLVAASHHAGRLNGELSACRWGENGVKRAQPRRGMYFVLPTAACLPSFAEQT